MQATLSFCSGWEELGSFFDNRCDMSGEAIERKDHQTTSLKIKENLESMCPIKGVLVERETQ